MVQVSEVSVELNKLIIKLEVSATF